MEKADYLDIGIGLCTTWLVLDLREVCKSMYVEELEGYVEELEGYRQGCMDTADFYFCAVTLRHIDRL